MHSSPTPSLLSEYYPTSSSSLEQYTYLRILWLPLSVCFRWSGEQLSTELGTSAAATATATVTLSTDVSSSPNKALPLAGSSSGSSAPPSASLGGGSSSSKGPYSESFLNGNETTSGYEVALRRSVALHPPVPASELSWRSFPAVSTMFTPPNTPSEPNGLRKPISLVDPSASLRFFLTSNPGTSRWENMDSHRATVAVVVVVNTTALTVPVEHAVEVVSTIFAAQFRSKVCRCIVVDPPQALAVQLSQSSLYVCVSQALPVNQTAQKLLVGLAQAVVDAQGNALRLYCQPEKLDSTAVRTPMDKLTPFSTARNVSTMIASRFKKKAGDVLLQIGAVASALAVYGETQFNSNMDSLWCSATVESIAAARYRYLQTTLLCHRSALEDTVIQLQSDNPPWGPGLVASVDQLGSCVAQYGESLRQTIAGFKISSVPHSMLARLVREVEENVAAQVTLLKALLARVRVCLSAGTWEVPSDPHSYRLGGDVKRCVECVLRLAFSEIDLYLNEALRQLRKCVPTGTLMSSTAALVAAVSGIGGGGATAAAVSTSFSMLRKRELEIRFKRLELLAARKARQPFLAELSSLRSLFPGAYGDEWTVRSLLFFAYLSMINGAERRARALLVEYAAVKTRLHCRQEAAEVLLRVCALAGIGLPLVGLHAPASNASLGGTTAHADSSADPLCQLSRDATATRAPHLMESNNGLEASVHPNASISPAMGIFSALEEHAPDCGVARLNQLITNAALLKVPLLLELIEVFDGMAAATVTAALRCQLATLLLFQFPHLLEKATQRTLKSLVCETSALLEPQVSTTIVPAPFFLAWEAFPLPPHLAPQTVPVGGALFTFIDTQRLKLTILCLNGVKLGSRTVWTVGDVGSVLVTLYNPFHEPLVFDALALRCQSCASPSCADEDTAAENPAVSKSLSRPMRSPISYVLSDVEVSPLAKRKVLLQVQPTEEGTLLIDGVHLRLAETHSSQSITGKLPAPMHIPVLQRLPQVSCTLSTSELEVFGSQRIDFTVRVVNCGSVPITCISLTVHSEQCQLEGCEGCKERRSETETTVTLNKRALTAAARTPLQPGDVVIIPGTLEAPPTIGKFGAHYVMFRTDLSLPHPTPEKPANVPDAVPVYAVIPRRVTETRLRLFHSPGLIVTSVALTKDRHAVEVRVANRSRLYSMELQLTALAFAELPDAFIVAGAEYVVPPIKLTHIPPAQGKDGFRFLVPWVVRELTQCTGTLELDLSLISNELVSAEPLDECVVSLEVCVSHTALRQQAIEAPSLIVPVESKGLLITNASHREALSEGVVPLYRWESGGSSLYGKTERNLVVSRAKRGHCATGLPGATGVVTAAAAHDSVAQPAATAGQNMAHSRTLQEGDLLPGEVASNSAFSRRHTESMDWAPETGTVGLQSLNRDRYLFPTKESSEIGALKSGGHGSLVPIVIPAVTPIRLHLSVAAPRWRRAIPLHVHVSIDAHFDVAVLAGAVKADTMVGEGGRAVYKGEFELLAFKTGEHVLRVTIRDETERELTHTIHLIAEHSCVS
ncbi:hypothetical protein JKF63_01266 [Porcisia hertigi]|uniref:Uncharacterized protein n=1 Tax=Porcisia hertigi TaxID=2761500 RepID=A0A836H2X4_9TRYP|nr:hypothetical protein JKF63_01266 [Porcisia hertigi]